MTAPALAADRIGEIVQALCEHFEITEGIGLELHPANVNVKTLTKLKEAGVKTEFRIWDKALHGFLEVNHKEYPDQDAKNSEQEAYAKEAENYIAEELKKIWRKATRKQQNLMKNWNLQNKNFRKLKKYMLL